MQKSIGNYRWTICGLVFFATTINYLDRAVISLLKSTLSKEFSWSEIDYANIVVVFQLCYALGLLGAGRLIDKLGTKFGYALATTLWSIAAIAHAAATSTFGFYIARGALGVTEAGEGEDGRIKSAVGIGTLLEDGIGDTVRVSLTEVHARPRRGSRWAAAS